MWSGVGWGGGGIRASLSQPRSLTPSTALSLPDWSGAVERRCSVRRIGINQKAHHAFGEFHFGTNVEMAGVTLCVLHQGRLLLSNQMKRNPHLAFTSFRLELQKKKKKK